MRYIYLLIYWLCLPGYLLAQSSITDLRTKLEKADGDSQKIEAYKQIIRHYSVQNPDSESWYAEQAMQYAAKNKYPLGTARIFAQLASIDGNQGRVNLGKQRTEFALKIYREQHYLTGVAEMLQSLGAMEASEGNFDVAIKYFINTLKVYDSITDNHGLMLTYMNIGNLYVAHKDTANAWKYLHLAETVSKSTPLSDATIFLYNIVGVMHAENGNAGKALQIFLEDLKLSDKPAFITSHVECLLYLGEFYMDKGDTSQAFKYINEGLSKAWEFHLPEMESNLLLEIAKIKEKTNLPSAIEYLNKAKTLCENIHSKIFLVTIYNEIASVYKQQGNFKDALYATEQKQIYADSIFNINKSLEIAGIGYEYEFEKSNMRMNQLEILSRRNARERNVIMAIAAAIIIILVVLLFYFYRSRILNRQLALHKEELKDLNAMKDKLFSVIGHDLKGPIATIPAALDIYEEESTGAEEKKFILDNLKEHAKVSLETLDKLLYWGQSLLKGNRIRQVNFNPKDYINEAVEFKKMAASEKFITVTDNTPGNISIYADPAHFDFIVRNLLANAIKYTYNNGNIEIKVDATSRHGFTVFAVKDNGIGMNKDELDKLFTPLNSKAGTANEKGNGIGLMLCKEFALMNGGDIWVESEAGKGSTFYFSVKNAA